MLLAVVGAHLRGEPLNHLLTSRGGELVATTTTSPEYRLHALPLEPPRPGLVRVGGAGAAVEVEVWRLPVRGFGAVVAEVPSPLAIGRVRLADGSEVAGFLCEALAAEGTPDITGHGGWRAYRASGRAPAPGPG